MKKTILFFFSAILISCTNALFAQSSGFYSEPYSSRNSGSFDKGMSIVSLGYGFPNLSGTGYTWFTNGIGIGPAYLKFEQAVRDEVGVGGYVAVATSFYKYANGDIRRSTAFNASILGYYHFNKFIPLEKLDVYAGAGFGIRIQNYNDDFYNTTDSDLDPFPIVKIGVRWYLSNSFSVYAESGYDHMSTVNLGLGFSF